MKIRKNHKSHKIKADKLNSTVAYNVEQENIAPSRKSLILLIYKMCQGRYHETESVYSLLTNYDSYLDIFKCSNVRIPLIYDHVKNMLKADMYKNYKEFWSYAETVKRHISLSYQEVDHWKFIEEYNSLTKDTFHIKPEDMYRLFSKVGINGKVYSLMNRIIMYRKNPGYNVFREMAISAYEELKKIQLKIKE